MDVPDRRSVAVLEWHQAHFKVAWFTLSGAAFQAFFEDVMTRSDPSFVPVAPSGSHGDRKSDGFQTGDGTNYQVYSPEVGMQSAYTCKKIRDDFVGAKDHWPTMRQWVFVWSSPRGGLPADAARLIAELDAAEGDVEVRQWGEAALWDIVRRLPERDRNDLFRAYPDADRANDPETSADVSSLLNSVVAMERGALSESLELTPLRDKMTRNDLGPATERVVQGAISLTPTVRQIAEGHPDPGFNVRVAGALKGLYAETSTAVGDADAVFFGMIRIVARDAEMSDHRFWAAAAIVTRAFEICDVFQP